MADLFVGHWEMDVAANLYEFGTPPVQGDYIISAQDDGYLFTMRWTTAEGEAREMAFSGIPDGEWHPIQAPGVDAMRMTRDDRNLNNEVRAGERIVARATRTLSDDAQSLTVFQYGTKPDGQPFANQSLYRRRG